MPIFSGYGARRRGRPAERLRRARLLITADGFYAARQAHRHERDRRRGRRPAPTVEHVLVVRRLGREVPWNAGRDVWWHEALAAQSAECATERTDAEDPYMIIYTSGTTGQAQGRSARPLRLPDQGRAGHGPLLRRAAGRPLFWYHRHGLDDGAVGDQRQR